MTNITEESAVVGHGAEVRALTAVMSVPVGGAMANVPNVPAGGAALATPPTNNADAAATVATNTPGNNRVKNLFLPTVRLISAQAWKPLS
ncbi:MAG: hypothetical protein ACRDSH_16040 [Pseudonocardiaceae bacterium]